MKRITLGAAVIAVLALNTFAQEQDPSFEVVSVKAHQPDGRSAAATLVLPGGRLTMTNTPLTVLITQAYNIQPFQLLSAPTWAASRYDISAKAPEGVNLTPRMLRPMLADRFQLKMHTESREVQGYNLVVARGDGKLGPNLVASSRDCAAEMADARARDDVLPVPSPGQPLKCGVWIGPGMWRAGSVPMTQLAAIIGQRLGGPVIDRTELPRNFNVELTFTPGQLAPAAAGGGPIPANGAAIDSNGPSFLTAVQEQLGLKVESTKAPIEIFVIDHVERPRED